MFSQTLDDEGYQPCTALVILIQHGKINTFGKLQHVGFMRNKNIHVCPVGGVAFYLFERFHIDSEPFLSFRQSKDWYNIKFLRGRDRTRSISYDTHKKSYEAVFKNLGLTFNKKTHINRQQGVRQLENADVDISQTRRHGKWGMDTVEAVYSAPRAREAIRALSGHPPRSRLYYLERATIEPPEELKQQIFPELETHKAKILGGEWERNLAARGFIELLEYLRTVLLQDAAFLYDQLPVRVRNNKLFGEMFQQYREQAIASARTAQNPVEMQLQVAIPLLAQQMKTQHAAVIEKLESRHLDLIRVVKQTQDQLTSFLHGDMSFRLIPASVDTPIGSVGDTAASGRILNASTSSDQPHELPTSDAAFLQQYTMSRAVASVRELWDEWHHGIANNPSIEHLEQTFGTKWRSSAKESKFFSWRLCVIKYVRSTIDSGVPQDTAIERVDAQRGRKALTRSQNGCAANITDQHCHHFD